MVASSASNSIGLTSNSSQPVATAFSRSLSSANADIPMIGMSRVCGSFLRVPHRFPPISDRHFEVHQDYVRALGQCQLAALLAVLSRENLALKNQDNGSNCQSDRASPQSGVLGLSCSGLQMSSSTLSHSTSGLRSPALPRGNELTMACLTTSPSPVPSVVQTSFECHTQSPLSLQVEII